MAIALSQRISNANDVDTLRGDLPVAGTIEGRATLEKLEDLDGDYAAVSGGLTVIKGLDAGALLKNDKCV